MMKNSRKVVLAIFFSSLFFSRILIASPDVSPNDPIFGRPLTVDQGLQVIRATGCMPSFIQGDQIKTEREIARLLVEAEDCVKPPEGDYTSNKAFAMQVWADLRSQYEKEFDIEKVGRHAKFAWNDGHYRKPTLTLDNLSYTADRRKIPKAGINAYVDPWTAYREGYHFSDGYNILVSGKASVSLGSWFDLAVEPYVLSHNPSKYDFNVHSGNIKFSFMDFELKVGRGNTYWGQDGTGHALMSNNASPMEIVQIGSPNPFTIPWIFKALGPFEYRLMYGVMHDDQYYKYSELLAGRIMMKPLHNLEFGLTRTVLFGGRGAPYIAPWDALAQLFGFRFNDGWIFFIPYKKTSHEGAGAADNAMSIDFRVEIPSLRNTEIFLEWYDEDPIDFGDLFPEDSLFHGGVWIPRLNAAGDWQLLIEGTYSARIVYSHSVMRSGMANGQRTLGMDQGPYNAEGRIQVNKIFTKARLWTALDYQNYFSPPRLNNEQRIIFSGGGNVLLTNALRVTINGGYQHIEHFNFEKKNKESVFGEVQVQYQF